MNASFLRMPLCVTLLLLAASLVQGIAAEYFVNPKTGNDVLCGLLETHSAEGKGPLRTIPAALRRLKPGDTLHILADECPLRMMLDFYGFPGGTAEAPVTINGHGCTLSGADPLSPAGWEKQGNGLWVRSDIMAKSFLIMGDQFLLQTLGRDLLKPGEVTWEESEALFYFHPEGGQIPETIEVLDGKEWKTLEPARFERSHSKSGALRYRGFENVTAVRVNSEMRPLVNVEDRLSPGEWGVREGRMYFRTDETRPLENMEAVTRANGVQFGGTTSHVVIKNFNVRHVWNDAYNIHGSGKNLVFMNCNAFQCGDEGISAHGESEILLDGAVFEQCDVGITHIEGSKTIQCNIVIRDSRSAGFVIMATREGASHQLENIILINNPVGLSGEHVEGRNILIANLDSYKGARALLSVNGEIRLQNLTAFGPAAIFADLMPEAKLWMQNALVGPGPQALRLRSDDSVSMARISDSVFSDHLVVEHGAKPPWQKESIVAWIAMQSDSSSNRVESFPSEALENFAPAGCTSELWRRFLSATSTPSQP